MEDEKKLRLNKLVQGMAFHNHLVREKDPESYERNHFNLMSIGYAEEGYRSLSVETCMVLFNYFKNWVYEDSLKNYTSLISEEMGRPVVDHVHYDPEVKILHNLNSQLAFSSSFICHLGIIAEETIEQMTQDYDLPAISAFFPYYSVEQKMSFAIDYAERFLDRVSDNFGMKIKLPRFAYSAETTDSLAFYTKIEDETGNEVPVVCMTGRGIVLPLSSFIAVLQHELTHHLVQSFGTADMEWHLDQTQPYYQDYAQDFLLCFAKTQNADVTSGFFPSLYDEDKEEELCNLVGHMAGTYIARFTPAYQIAHQPDLMIQP